jgi:hypothetical protein
MKTQPTGGQRRGRRVVRFLLIPLLIIIGAGSALAWWVRETAIRNALPGEARALLENCDTMDVYTLNGHGHDLGYPLAGLPYNDAKHFRSYEIIGSLRVPDARTRAQVVGTLYDSFARSGSGMGFSLLCFDPHHGVRATRGTQRLELLICFNCGHMLVAVNGRSKYGHCPCGSDPGPLNRLLAARSVPLPAAPKP